MALYPPPRENVPIFDSFNFEINNTALTVDTGLEYFLAYPTAQGAQTMDNTNISGTLTAFGSANFTSTIEGSLTSSATQPLPNDNTTKIPTTAWVQTAIATGGVAETLSQILQSGNSANIYDIDMNENDVYDIDNVKTKVVNFRDISTGAATTTRIYQDNLVLTLDNTQLNSSIIFQTNTSGNVSVTPLSIGNTVNNMNVALDMTNTGSLSNAQVRARYFTFRDLDTSVITSSGMYFQSSVNNLSIDAQGTSTAATGLYMRIFDNVLGTLQVGLALTKDWVKTNIPLLPNNDNSNSIPTTQWVKNVLTSSSYLSPSTIRRASATGNFTGGSGPNQIFQINLTGTGTSGIWSLNQGVTFRVNYFQSFTPRGTSPFDSQNFISYSGMLTLYPYRFTLGWLADIVSSGPRGRVSDNVIVTTDGNSNLNYVVFEATTTPNGRQFWSNDISFQSNSSFAGRLFVYGSAVSTNAVFFELSKPAGYSEPTQTYNYNFSIELVNQSNLSSTIVSTGFNISNL